MTSRDRGISFSIPGRAAPSCSPAFVERRATTHTTLPGDGLVTYRRDNKANCGPNVRKADRAFVYTRDFNYASLSRQMGIIVVLADTLGVTESRVKRLREARQASLRVQAAGNNVETRSTDKNGI